MGTICLSLTKQIRDIAEELHENPQVILAKVQAYMTEKNTTIIPTITQLKQDGYLDRKVETLSNNNYNEEENEILRNAKRDEQGRLLAPNGKVSNLSEKQYAQVRTKAFKNWFGDWENDPTNASKVIDENGEPLVVYHGSPNEFNTFDSSKSTEKRKFTLENTYYFTSNKRVAQGYGKNLIPSFINIRNPHKYNFEGRSWRNDDWSGIELVYQRTSERLGLFKSVEEAEEYKKKFLEENPDYAEDADYITVNTEAYLGKKGKTTDEQLKDAIENNNDGAIFENVLDYADYNDELSSKEIKQLKTPSTDVVVFNPNQVKSAESNVGTFDVNNNNIYHHLRQTKSPKDTLFEILRKEGLIHKWNSGDRYVLTTGAGFNYGSKNDLNYVSREDLINNALNKIKIRLNQLGLPTDLVSIQVTKNGGTAFVQIDDIKMSQIKDAIDSGKILNPNDFNDTHLINSLANFFTSKFNIQFKRVSPGFAENITGNKNVNAFIQGNIVYIVEGKVTADTIAEEFLHPFVNTLYNKNRDAFNDLYKEASKQFPNLKLYIEDTYGKNKKTKFFKEDLEQELVTQALSRHFREEFEKSLKDNKRLTTEETLNEMSKIAQLASKFWNAIKNLFKSLNNKIYNNFILLDFQDLSGLSLRNIAQLLNTSDSTFDINYSNNINFNLSEERPQHEAEQINENEIPQHSIANAQTNEALRKLSMDFTPFEIEARSRNVANWVQGAAQELARAYRDNILEQIKNSNDEIEKEKLRKKISSEDEDVETLTAFLLSKGYLSFNDVLTKTKQNIEEYKSWIDDDLSDEEKLHQEEQYNKVLDNFETLVTQSLQQIEEALEVKISLSDINSESYEESDALEEDEDEERVAEGNSGWAFKIRMKDAHETLSQKVKRFLRSIQKVNRVDGNYEEEYDDLGYPVYVNEGYAYSVIQTYLSDMDSPEDFHYVDEKGEHHFPALEGMIERYPFVNELITMLKIKADIDPTIIPLFYSGFRNDYINYYTMVDGKFLQANRTEGAEIAYNAVLNDYENGIATPLTIWGNDRKLQSNKVGKANSLFGSLKSAMNDNIGDILLGNKHIDRNKLIQGKTQFKMLYDLLESIGINAENLESYLTPTESNKYYVEQSTEKILNSISEILAGADRYVKNGNTDVSFVSDYQSRYRDIAGIVGETSKFARAMTFRQGKGKNAKDYASYSAPNYISTLFKRLLNTNPEKRKIVLDQYKKDPRFYFGGVWKNKILEFFDRVDTDSSTQRALDDYRHTCLINVNYLNGETYENWTPADIAKNFIHIYYSVPEKPGAQTQYGYYHFPIFADSPCAMFMKFERIPLVLKGGEANKKQGRIDFENKIISQMENLVFSELSRFALIDKRALDKTLEKIANFDKNGKNFFYFLEMNNDEKFKSDLNNLIQQKNEFQSKNMTNSLQDINKQIGYLIREKLRQCIRIEFEQYKKEIEPYRNEIMFELSREGVTFSDFELQELDRIREMEQKKIPLGDSEKNLKNKIVRFSNQDDALMEYFYNSELMTGNIIQMTAVDPAFFKFDGGIDFQKRYKEGYASGQRLDTTAKYGRKIEKTLYLKDYHQASMILKTIKDTFQKAVDEHKITKEEYQFIVDSYADINVTDAQAYRSLSSMRAVLSMAGKWTDAFDEAFDRIQNGEWTYDDFLMVWSTLKPFVFSITSKQVTKDEKDGEMLVPHQNKNSEFLLMTMYDLFAGATRNSATMRGLSRFMEDYQIDVAQYESAVKCGGQGIIDINYSIDTINKILNGEIKSINGISNQRLKEIVDAINSLKNNEDVADKITENALELLEDGKITQNEYNSLMQAIQPTEEEVYNTLQNTCFVRNSEGKLTDTMNDNVVHTLNYEDYMFAQPTKPHLKDQDAVDGSQIRNLIIADISENATFEIDGKIYHKKDIIDAYNKLYIANLCEDYEDTYGQVSDKQKLSEFLVRQVTGNPKYSKDMQNVLRLNKDGEFTIPLDFPSVSVKIQDLMLSKFKNGVTKQKTKGAACILASCVGLSHSLKIVLSDGSTLNASDENAVKNAIDNNLIKGAECYLPASSKQFFEDFLVTKTMKTKDRTGNIVERTYQELDIEKMPKELRECVGYRIPTENKCSMMPLIIKGFLPETNDGTIMLPADITVIAGSDFDVDKMFLMFYEYDRIKYDKNKAYKDFIELKKSQNGQTYLNSDEAKKLAEAIGLEMDIEDNEELPESFTEFFKQNKEKYKLDKPRYQKVKYNYKKTYLENRREARNNYLLDIRLSILKNKDSALNFFNPSNFESLKKDTDVVMIARDHKLLKQYMLDKGIKKGNYREAYKSLSRENLKYLKNFLAKYKEKNPLLSPITFMRNHNQNMTGGKLVGIYANNTSMQTKYQTSDLALKDNYAFYFNDVKFKSLHDIKTVRNGVEYYISKNCGYFQAASVDNVKDPVVANLMQNEKTAHITGFMLRLGMLPSEIALFFSQDEVMYNILTKGEISAKSLTQIINRQIEYYKKNYGIKVTQETDPNYNYNSEELAESIALKNELRETISGTQNEQEKQEKLKEFGAENLLKTANNEIKYLRKFLDIINLAEQLRPSVNISRADSPNGAIDITLAGANAQQISVEKWQEKTKEKEFPFVGADKIVRNELSEKNGQIRPDLSKEELFNILSSNENQVQRLQAFYTLGIDNAVRAFKHYFLSQSDAAQQVSSELRASIDGDYNTEPLLQNLYKSLITWQLSKTKLFGDDEKMTYEQKRDYYLYKFPDQFIKFRDSHPDLFFSGVLSLLQVKNGRIQIERSGRITPTVRETLQNSFDQLMYSTDPEVINFAQDLFMYSYYLDGFYFGPNSYGAFFSSNFLLNFTEILDTLRNVNPNYNELSDIEDVFAVQNHSLWRQYEVEQDNKKLIISGDKAYVTEYKPKKYITINSEKDNTTYVYKLVNDSDYLYADSENILLDESQDNQKSTYEYQKLNDVYSPFGDLYNGNKKLEDYNYPKTEEAEKRYQNLKLLNSASLHTRRYQKQIITQQSNTQQTTTQDAVLGQNENESNFDSMASSIDEQLEYGVGVNEFKTENDQVDAMLEQQRLKDQRTQEIGEKWMEEHSSQFDDVNQQEANLKYDTEESQKVQTNNGGERICQK